MYPEQDNGFNHEFETENWAYVRRARYRIQYSVCNVNQSNLG